MNNQANFLILQSYSHIYLISRKSMNITLFKNVSLKDILVKTKIQTIFQEICFRIFLAKGIFLILTEFL